MQLRPLVSLALLLLAAACGSAEREPTFTVTDSAGVRIVRNKRPIWTADAAWRVDSSATVSFGAREDDTLAMLQHAEGAMRRSDGTFAVGDRGSSQVKYYDADGRFVRAVGRQGKGPGEYEYMAWLKACGGDSAFVLDIGSRQVSVLAPDGRIARSFVLKTSEAVATPFTTTCRRDGRFLTSGWGDMKMPPQQAPYRPNVAVDLTGADGIPRRTLGQFPGTEMSPVRGGAGPRRGGRWLRLALSRDGAWVAPDDDRGILGYDSTGTLVAVVHPLLTTLPLKREDAELLRALALDSVVLEQERKRRQGELDALKFPERLPSFLDIITDADGNLWVHDFPRASAPDPAWNVYRHDGAWLGAVRLPARLRIFEIGTDYILGIRTAESGADEVVMFRLRINGVRLH